MRLLSGMPQHSKRSTTTTNRHAHAHTPRTRRHRHTYTHTPCICHLPPAPSSFHNSSSSSCICSCFTPPSVDGAGPVRSAPAWAAEAKAPPLAAGVGVAAAAAVEWRSLASPRLGRAFFIGLPTLPSPTKFLPKSPAAADATPVPVPAPAPLSGGVDVSALGDFVELGPLSGSEECARLS